jgi:hypothetical protein
VDAMTKLYFCPYNRRYALDMVAAFTAGISKRVLGSFDDIEAEAEAASETYFNERINEPAEYDDPDDDDWEYREERVYQAAEGHAQRVYSDLEFVRWQVTGLAVSGLYHLWERLLKEFLIQEGLREKRSIHGADFKKLTMLLSDSGWNISAQDFYPSLERLCLVANTVKHGDGQSCEKLLATAPELFFDFGGQWMNESRRADDLRLDAGHFEQFTRAVRAFFEQFPERLP